MFVKLTTKPSRGSLLTTSHVVCLNFKRKKDVAEKALNWRREFLSPFGTRKTLTNVLQEKEKKWKEKTE